MKVLRVETLRGQLELAYEREELLERQLARFLARRGTRNEVHEFRNERGDLIAFVDQAYLQHFVIDPAAPRRHDDEEPPALGTGVGSSNGEA